MFQAIIHGMGRLLAYFFEAIPNYGVAIILLTVAVRLAMIPLAVKQARVMEANRGNQEKMRKLAPEIKKLKEKYKDDRARLYEEQKKLYDLHGINMLGSLSGCLPMLLQMPIFMAMYQVLSGCNKLFGGGRVCLPEYYIPSTSELHTAIAEGQARFLSMNLNLRPSQVYGTAGLPDALPYYLLIVLMGVTMWYQMKMMTKAQPAPDPQLAQTQKIMQIMPLMFVVFSVNFPVGLTVYWTASNVWTIGQQYVLLKRIGMPPTAEAPRPAPSTAPGFLGRLLGQGSAPKGSAGAGKQASRPAPKASAGRERPGPKSGAKAGTRGDARASRSRDAGATASRHRSSRAAVNRASKGASADGGLEEKQAGTDVSRPVVGNKAVGARDEDGAANQEEARKDGSQPAKNPRQSSGKGSAAKRGGGAGGSGSRTQGKGRPRGGGSKAKSSSHRKNRGGRR